MSKLNPTSINIHNITQIDAKPGSSANHTWVVLSFGDSFALDITLFFDDPALAHRLVEALAPLPVALDDEIPF